MSIADFSFAALVVFFVSLPYLLEGLRILSTAFRAPPDTPVPHEASTVVGLRSPLEEHEWTPFGHLSAPPRQLPAATVVGLRSPLGADLPVPRALPSGSNDESEDGAPLALASGEPPAAPSGPARDEASSTNASTNPDAATDLGTFILDVAPLQLTLSQCTRA